MRRFDASVHVPYTFKPHEIPHIAPVSSPRALTAGTTLLLKTGTFTLMRLFAATRVAASSSCLVPTTMSPTKLRFSLRTLLITCTWWSFLLTLYVNVMPMSWRVALASIMICPFYTAWKGSKYNLSLLAGVATGIGVSIFAFLGLCAVGQLEPFWVHAASSMTIGFASGIIGWLVAPQNGSSDEPEDATVFAKGVAFRRQVLSVFALSAVLFAAFLFARGFHALYQDAQTLHCSKLQSQGAVVAYRPLNLPAWVTRLLGENATVASRVAFFEAITPEAAYSLRELETVTSVSLIGNDMDDDSLSKIPESLQLTEMCLGDTLVTDNGLEMLQRWPRIKSLALNRTPVGDGAIPYIARLRSLEELQILSTDFSTNGTEMLKKLLPACQQVAGEWTGSQL